LRHDLDMLADDSLDHLLHLDQCLRKIHHPGLQDLFTAERQQLLR
jgi:hypothetical protein